MAARLIYRLPGFLRRPLTVDVARAIVQERLDCRAADFLRMARQAIYPVPENPFRVLLASAAIEYGDLERLVRDYGLEAALGLLYRQGVYLTVDEFKGRAPVIRGSLRLAVKPEQLRNPGVGFHALNRTSGSRGPSTPVRIDLAHIWDGAVETLLALDARGGLGWRHGVWGDPGVICILQIVYAAFGRAPLHWFSQVNPRSPEVHARYRWSVRAARAASQLAGEPLGQPEFVPLDDPRPIALWLARTRQARQVPHLITYTSTAVRVCLAAMEAGIDIEGTQFSVGGEPVTAARLAVIRRAGATAAPHYGSTETGGVGTECLAPTESDDVHLCQDRVAVVQPGPDGALNGLPPTALLVSSLRPTAPFVLVNVSMGDQAQLVQRRCGCPKDRPGWDVHLHTIRSFEKLTAGGMTFLDTDVARVLEEVLPARFGGAPTDYQLVEEHLEDGQPRLRLLVHPGVGTLDASLVAASFLQAIGSASDRERVMELQWRQANLLRVERRAPLTTGSGKILHLHLGPQNSPGTQA